MGNSVMRLARLPAPLEIPHVGLDTRGMVMADKLELFTSLEQQVIALAARSSRECVPVGSNPIRRAFSRVVNSLAGDHSSRPLANERLEALRRLACISFATAGRPAERSIRPAVDAGFSGEQIEGLKRLASGWSGQMA
jgi:hypothetical protein